LRSERDIRLRIDLLESQSSTIAKVLAKAMKERNQVAYSEHSERLALNRGRIEELLWVLGERAGHSILDLQIPGSSAMTVRQTIEKLRKGEVTMAELPSDAQALVRKGALELKDTKKV
jgi:hypothetical protein